MEYFFIIKVTALGGNIKFWGVYLYVYCEAQINVLPNSLPIEQQTISTYVGANTIGDGMLAIY